MSRRRRRSTRAGASGFRAVDLDVPGGVRQDGEERGGRGFDLAGDLDPAFVAAH
jgi:hypothetical protein